ncbi:MAG: hypothetical protein LBL74_06190 [Bacteroidales bacterium]|jgi:hypothetical protein|nr:hypothetical protein [Bacteroidales bacterium]
MIIFLEIGRKNKTCSLFIKSFIIAILFSGCQTLSPYYEKTKIYVDKERLSDNNKIKLKYKTKRNNIYMTIHYDTILLNTCVKKVWFENNDSIMVNINTKARNNNVKIYTYIYDRSFAFIGELKNYGDYKEQEPTHDIAIIKISPMKVTKARLEMFKPFNFPYWWWE